MYINPFLAGVLATIFAEIAIVVIGIIFAAVKRTKR